MPDPSAQTRLFFYEEIPPSSHARDPKLQFAPLATTTFVVTGVVMPPPVIYPLGKDEYLLRIKFPDGKEGYVNVVGPVGLKRHMSKGTGESPGEYVKEYVSTEPTLMRDRAGDTPTDPGTLAELDALKRAPPIEPHEPDFSPDEVQMLALERSVARKKGNWWQIPRDLQHAEEES